MYIFILNTVNTWFYVMTLIRKKMVKNKNDHFFFLLLLLR